MKSIRVPAHAKVNLRLEILGRRADGYHELRTIFQTLSLHDTLTLEMKRKPGIELHIAGNSQLAGEPGPDNLVYRALRDLPGNQFSPGRSRRADQAHPRGPGNGRRVERCRCGVNRSAEVDGETN
jgi:4-diphosphocytidyl-2-C-methyl-D-erythritol kinase